MPQANKDWTIRPHGLLQQLADNLWIVDGEVRMPPGPLPRRMTIGRLADGGLLVFSAIALGESEMQKIEALGRPAVLVVPNAFHRLDAPAWKARYQDIRVVTPEAARKKVEEVVPVDGTTGDFSDPNVTLVTVPGTGEGEAALVVRSQSGTTLVINDLIGNVQNAKGLMRIALSLMGFGGSRPQVPRAFKMRMVKDGPAVGAQFSRWATIPDLKRVVVSHGSVIDTDPGDVLRQLAKSLTSAA
jgi:hypothetical protein